MSDSESQAETPAPRPLVGNGVWWFLTAIAILVGVVMAFRKPFETAENTVETVAETAKEVVVEVAEAAVDLAEKLRPEIHETNLTAWRDLSVKPTKGNLLEIATAKSSETFSRTKNVSLFDLVLPGSTSVTELTVPATYRFHIDLDDEWKVTTEGKRVVVRAPKIRPTLPVAFDTAGVVKRTDAGWARWNLDEDLAELEKGITEQLAVRAADPATIARIENEGRLAVARFVRNWLLTRGAWGGGAFEEIIVIFEGEEETPDVLPPMLRIERSGAVLP